MLCSVNDGATGGLRRLNYAGLDSSKALQEVYSSLWVLRQAMINSGTTEHFTAFIETVMGRVQGLMRA